MTDYHIEFEPSPEFRTAIQEGIDEADRGEVISLEQSRSDLQAFKAQWRAKNNLT